MIKLDDWYLMTDHDPYKAPEQMSIRLGGFVREHPRLGKGHIQSSPIAHVRKENDDVIVETISGSIYVLGNVHVGYEKEYPGARERMLARAMKG